MASKSFQIFKSIASVISATTRKTTQEVGSEDESMQNSTTAEPWHLLTVRTRHLSKLVEALDKTTIGGYPAFYPSAAQLIIVTQAREGGTFHAKDAPVDYESYVALRKAALKGLRACGLAYKKVWDEESTVVADIPQQPRALAGTNGNEDDDLVVAKSQSSRPTRTLPVRSRGNDGRGSTSSRKRPLAGSRRQGTTSNKRRRRDLPRSQSPEDARDDGFGPLDTGYTGTDGPVDAESVGADVGGPVDPSSIGGLGNSQAESTLVSEISDSN